VVKLATVGVKAVQDVLKSMLLRHVLAEHELEVGLETLLNIAKEDLRKEDAGIWAGRENSRGLGRCLRQFIVLVEGVEGVKLH